MFFSATRTRKVISGHCFSIWTPPTGAPELLKRVLVSFPTNVIFIYYWVIKFSILVTKSTKLHTGLSWLTARLRHSRRPGNVRDSTMILAVSKLRSGFSRVFFEWELESEVMTGRCPHALIPNKVAQVMWHGVSWAKWQRAEDRQKSSTNENYLPRQTASVPRPARHPAAPSSLSARWSLSRRAGLLSMWSPRAEVSEPLRDSDWGSGLLQAPGSRSEWPCGDKQSVQVLEGNLL